MPRQPSRRKRPPGATRRRVTNPDAPTNPALQSAREQTSATHFPIVGVGASAGGLEAFRRLLGGLPPDRGMAYVLVQHLDPSHDSILAELLSKTTRMPVAEVRADTRVEPDHVYITPPEQDIVLSGGTLKRVPRTQAGGRHMPIDRFLCTLAEESRERAIGVILSGAASDGTIGLKAIKEGGGIAFAQDPETTPYDGMPRSAIASGAVDIVLSPEGIAGELSRLGRHPYVVREPAEERAEGKAPPDEKDALRRIMAALRRATGADFSGYKPSTIQRRIARRMALARVDTLSDYARLLDANLEEAKALHEDCLIGVTSFFREPEAFQALSEQVLPRLLQERPRKSPIRVWVPGCATGEEVYSIAICLLERMGETWSLPSLQIFATDLSDSSVDRARAGTYPETIEQDVSAERLRRFFTRADGRYLVSKTLRELCVFARHNLTRDPPFSRLDLISCRNVLIYLDTPLQQKVLATFHYALQPSGFLMLGTSETVGPLPDLFAAVDKKHRIYAKRAVASPMGLGFTMGARTRDEGSARAEDHPPATAAGSRPSEIPGQADRILLARYAPAGVIVDEGLNILEFRGDTSPYLEHPQGSAGLALLRMARKGLLRDLREVIEQARRNGAPARKDGVPCRHGGRARKVGLEAIPLHGREAKDHLLVTFDEREARPREPPPIMAARPRSAGEKGKEQARLREENERLRQELAEATQSLSTITQEHEAANEELQSANEEALSANEELQSINEELETAQEELQSTNEELSTLNQEVQERNRQLATVNDDLLNLLTSIDIPLVMLGADFRLRRFTPAAEKLFNLIPGDVGRPLSDFRLNLDLPDLEREVVNVIERVQAIEREVSDRSGRAYSMRIRPYRTLENKIDGAVVVLVDIDALKRARDNANAIVDTTREPMLVLDANLRVERANRSFYEAFTATPEETEGRLLYDLGDRQWDGPDLRRALEAILPRHGGFADFEVERDFPSLGRRLMVLNARKLRHPESSEEKILLGIEDRTASRALVLEREARRKAEEADRIKDDFMATLSHELRGPLNAMAGWTHALRSGTLDEAAAGRGLAAIDRAVKAQTRLIEDLLDFSRMTMGKMRLSRRPVQLAAVVQAAAETVRAAAEAKEIALTVATGNGSTTVTGDPDRLQQVVWNVLSNAIKFTPRGGRIEVSTARVGTQLQVRVTDTGDGIRPDFLPHVFERFRQAQTGPSRAHGGLGLGLAIAKQLVELHGGSVEAKSDGEGKGSTFTVTLPIPTLVTEEAGAETEPKTSREDSTPVDPAILRGLRLLIVEDEPDGREMLATLLARYGAKVKAVASAAEALEALEGVVPDVLVSDVGLPGLDGYELMRRVRALAPDRAGRVPSLALTAYSSPDDVAMALTAGFDAYLSKPAVPHELAREVAALARRGAGP